MATLDILFKKYSFWIVRGPLGFNGHHYELSHYGWDVMSGKLLLFIVVISVGNVLSASFNIVARDIHQILELWEILLFWSIDGDSCDKIEATDEIQLLILSLNVRIYP